ncbi:NmrA family NAD(P)-binding protein [Larkinella knui]|uniref:NAD-dependent epimerase/dehydratase family protein n=1 Tax=Larkinella knui TaxID=2025310 RepID=A0A3P1CQW7_9BACT|nr:NmrA family NAD(P)-binding protein [Larkinella knui]RRB15476.1 NAD-dependent epimerase/dehydratase family protein [Larkinella knui]
MATSFLITGASGNVGAAVLEHLGADKNHRIVTTTHAENKASETERWLDFEQPDSFENALKSIDVVFLLRPPQLADVNTYFAPFIAACQGASIQQIVFLSVQGAEEVSFIPHAKIEKLIRQSGIAYTFIRPSYFMQNLTTTLRSDIVRDHRLFLPAGKAPFLWVDVADIGRATAVVLARWREHQNRAYTITGTELRTFGQVAAQRTHRVRSPFRESQPDSVLFYETKAGNGVGDDPGADHAAFSTPVSKSPENQPGLHEPDRAATQYPPRFHRPKPVSLVLSLTLDGNAD